MHTAALILALTLGAIGLATLVGTFLYAQRRVREGTPVGQRRMANRTMVVALLFWVAAALLVNGMERDPGEDVVARVMLVVAGLLFVALVVTTVVWLRRNLLSLTAARRRRTGA